MHSYSSSALGPPHASRQKWQAACLSRRPPRLSVAPTTQAAVLDHGPNGPVPDRWTEGLVPPHRGRAPETCASVKKKCESPKRGSICLYMRSFLDISLRNYGNFLIGIPLHPQRHLALPHPLARFRSPAIGIPLHPHSAPSQRHSDLPQRFSAFGVPPTTPHPQRFSGYPPPSGVLLTSPSG